MSARFRLLVAYDGSGFSGWQVQPDRRTVQGTLAGMLGAMGERELPQGAGRTDAGVHALGNVAHVDLERPWAPADLQRGLDALAPPDLRVLGVACAGDGFHARYGAAARSYAYAFGLSDDIFFRDRRWTPRRLPEAAWAAAALDAVRGEHDFASFARADAETRSTRCALHAASWRAYRGGAILAVTADRFLHGMVRTLAGAVVHGFTDGEPPGYLRRVLDRRDRCAAGPAAPGGGLYLTEVRYPGEPAVDRVDQVAFVAGLDPREEEA
jgi:tRNA pseudouridine38-40 synthase